MKKTARINLSAKITRYLRLLFCSSLLLLLVAIAIYVLINSPA